MADCDLVNLVSKLKRFIALWAVFYASVKAEIRCYCNQPSCVSTGYMCKSVSDVCFTELFSYSNDLSKSRHGCVELLIPKKRAQCRPPKAEVGSLPVILCCREDMCNYMNTMDINIQVHTQANRTQATGAYDFTKDHAYEAALQQDIWFKAAVIAVPIAGGFILILLILLATRMLRQDSKRQRQLLEMRQQQRLYSKPHFLIAQPCVGHPNCSFNVMPQSSKVNHAYSNACVSSHNWYADSVASNGGHFVYDKSTSRNSMRETLLPWPKVHHQKSSTHV